MLNCMCETVHTYRMCESSGLSLTGRPTFAATLRKAINTSMIVPFLLPWRYSYLCEQFLQNLEKLRDDGSAR